MSRSGKSSSSLESLTRLTHRGITTKLGNKRDTSQTGIDLEVSLIKQLCKVRNGVEG